MFGVSLEDVSSVATRGEDNGLDSVYVAHTPWDKDFYIQLNTTDDNGNPQVDYGVYVVPSAYEGRLMSKDPEKALDWKNLTKDHTFYSWTVPWMETADNDNNGASKAEGYIPSEEPLDVTFYDSSEETGFNIYKNNAVLEGLIGAKSEPYSYTRHGKYVDLTFFHLVSRIRVEGMMLIQTDGSVQKELQADMTFVGMPTGAKLYPHPTAGDESGAPVDSRPYVGKPWVASPDEGVTYFIHNVAGEEDLFYICPEVDFSTIDYQIRITSEDYEHMDIYYGTFDDVVFERTSGWAHDQGVDDEGNVIDDKILHAGEEMRINLVLIPGIGPGLKIIISDWSTDKSLESQYHPHQGFYSESEINQLMDLLYGFNADSYNNPPEELELLFEMYGYEKDGKKYFPLFNNLTIYKNNAISNIFPIPPGYIIDGMGHTVTLKTNEGSYWGNEGSAKYFNIGGICRDIYFSDENGNNTIYIDPEGYVWVTDEETGQLRKTANQLPEEMPENVRGYDISCKTGSLRPTTYYNDHLGS